MQTLNLILRSRMDEGEPLPPVFKRLDQLGAKFRRGQLSMIAAAPGGGKSSFALQYAIKGKVPTLYFSADCDRMTVSKSALAGLSGETLEKAEWGLVKEHPGALKLLADGTSHVWFDFEPSPGLSDIYEEVSAYGHVHGEYPHLIVVDNLMDVSAGGPEYEKFGDVVVALNDLARKTGAHVMVLCHVTGFYTDGGMPIPRSAIIQKVDKKPRLILTLHKVQDGIMGVRIVKNTAGYAASDATFGPDYGWMPERAWWSE